MASQYSSNSRRRLQEGTQSQLGCFALDVTPRHRPRCGMMRMTPATEPLLSQLRSQYLDSLCEPQELYCEAANGKAAAYLSWVSNEVIGYALTDGSGTLLEFHVADE